MLFSKGDALLLSSMSFDHDAMVLPFPDDIDGSELSKACSQSAGSSVCASGSLLFKDLEEAKEIAQMERFQVKGILGSGSYGRVYLAYDKEMDRLFAMKVVCKKDLIHHDSHRHLTNELFISQLKIACPFVNNAAMIFEGPKHHFLVGDFLEGGELYYLIREKGTFSEPQTRFYAAELLIALDTLHKHGVLYRDLKPENILLHSDGHIGLVDFGLSRPNFTHSDAAKTLCGTAEYVAPEMLVGDPYGFPIDAWGLGCVVFEMLAGSPPFYDTRPSVMNENIVFNSPKFPSTLSPCCIGLINGLLAKRQEKRTTVKEAMTHPWFTGVDWDGVRRRALKPPFKPVPMQAITNATKRDATSSSFDSSFNKGFIQTP